MTEKPKTVT